MLSPPPQPQVQCVLTSSNASNEGALEIDWGGGDLEVGQEETGEEVMGMDTSVFEIVVEGSGTTLATAG